MYNNNEVNKMDKKQTLNLIWKAILENCGQDIFPEFTTKIDWKLGVEDLEEELLKIEEKMNNGQYGIESMGDRLIKVRIKDNKGIILFIHLHMKNIDDERADLGETMFRYFGKIMEKFRYEYNDDSAILSAAIYSSKYTRINEINNYKDNESLIYNFRAIDIEEFNDDNPMKLIFKATRSILKGEDTESASSVTKTLADEVLKYNTKRNNKLNLNELYKKLTIEHKDIYKKIASK